MYDSNEIKETKKKMHSPVEPNSPSLMQLMAEGHSLMRNPANGGLSTPKNYYQQQQSQMVDKSDRKRPNQMLESFLSHSKAVKKDESGNSGNIGIASSVQFYQNSFRNSNAMLQQGKRSNKSSSSFSHAQAQYKDNFNEDLGQIGVPVCTKTSLDLKQK